MNLRLKASQHIFDLFFNHIGHIEVDASADRFEQRVGISHVLTQTRQVKILCADQFILALCHCLTTLSLYFRLYFSYFPCIL